MLQLFLFLLSILQSNGFLLDNGHSTGNRGTQRDINALLTEERQSRQRLESYVSELYHELSMTKQMASNLTKEYQSLKKALQTDWRNMSGCNSAKLTDESNADQCCIETQYLINNVLTIQDNIYGLLSQAITDMEDTKCKISSSTWTAVFLACANNGQSVINSWNASSSTSTTINGAVTSDASACRLKQVRSSLIDNWSKHNIDQVKVEIYKNGSVIAAFYFNGLGTNHFNWFSKENLLGTTYTDLTRSSTVNYFSIEGIEERHFYINEHFGGCPADEGWLLVRDVTGQVAPCHFDHLTKPPYFIVSPGNKKGRFESGQYILADTIEISVHTNTCKCPSPISVGTEQIIG
ncbi:unnamed protein product [Mytilus coruscus]|uniref:Fibrinogen C-terminal domain-containing protein n=1 Tax=Mytilus coruscus TaxID=42192 RepID=A0A6J8BEJ1_MYTCO|nr:unnamed protein product [Mytilus coruscus]